MWRSLGREGLAVKAPWLSTDKENKILTRQAKFLRDCLKTFRSQAGKAKKGWKTASVLLTDNYPQWKIDTLLWLQSQYSPKGSFSETFMKDLKDWTTKTVTDKRMVKLTMQFASFMKNEADDFGRAALDVTIPFDEKEILAESEMYIKAQLSLDAIGFLDISSGAVDIPDKIVDLVSPGKPYLWMR